MKPFPELVYFRVTSRCNNNCKCCFGSPKDLEEFSFLKLQELFSHFSKNSVKAVALTGGEPMIREDFGSIVNELKKYDFKIFLDTNGDLFFKYSEPIMKNIDVLGLPIDFPDGSYRNPDNLNTVLGILDFFRDRVRRPVIRIGTVVTKDNIDQMEKIELISTYPVDIWKIYEFIPQNINAIRYMHSLEVSPEEFDSVSKRIKEKYSCSINTVISRRKNRTNAYFFTASDGTVFMPVDNYDICREIKIGDIFDKDIVEKWEGFVSGKNYRDNASVTFGYKI